MARYDPQRNAYKSFFDHDWAGQILELTADTLIRSSVERLLVQWKAWSLTHAMPWLMTESIQRHGEGLIGSSNSIAQPVTAAIDLRLIQLIGEPLSRGMQERIRTATHTLASEVLVVERQAKDHARNIDRRDEMWSEFLGREEFCLMLWGCQRMCYACVYFAYEEFVRECVQLAGGELDKEKWAPISKVIKLATRLFGPQVTAQCLTNDRVTIAGLARNCLAHAGGKVSPQLRALPHNFEVEDDIIQIRAEDTVALFNDLRDRVRVLADAMLRIPNPVPPS